MIKTFFLSFVSLSFISCQEGGKDTTQRDQYMKQKEEILSLERELKDLRDRVAAVKSDGVVGSVAELQDQIKEGKLEIARLASELEPLQETAKKATQDLADFKTKHGLAE